MQGSSTPYETPANQQFFADQSDIVQAIQGMEKRMDERLHAMENRIEKISQKLDGKCDKILKVLELEPYSELSENLKAELRVSVNAPIIDKVWDNLIQLGEVKWEARDREANQTQYLENSDRKLDMIINELQRIRQPYHTSH